MYKNIDNTIKPIGEPLIYLIQGNNFIKIQLFQKRQNQFYDVTFYNNDNEIFIGRFNNDYTNFRIAYNKGKILIYSDNSNEQDKTYAITQVISLYDILDETFYSLTPIEMLETFAPNLSNYYTNKDNKTIHRTDSEKRKRLEIK